MCLFRERESNGMNQLCLRYSDLSKGYGKKGEKMESGASHGSCNHIARLCFTRAPEQKLRQERDK
jgi:hypothetical protein